MVPLFLVEYFHLGGIIPVEPGMFQDLSNTRSLTYIFHKYRLYQLDAHLTRPILAGEVNALNIMY